MNRRNFLGLSALAGGGVVFAAFCNRASLFKNDGEFSQLRSEGFGDLFPTATKNTGEVFLALPRGFEYTLVSKAGDQMSDGKNTPGRPDGMAAFTIGGELILVRNHELAGDLRPISNASIGTDPYDETAPGGTTTLIIDPETRLLKREFISLSGTLNNCAGGATPWGTWISCEETVLGKSVRTDYLGKTTGGFEKPHGYCFEVSAVADSAVPPLPLKAMGRFTHEAVAVDAKTGEVYLTEDYMAAGFYRFLPRRKQVLAEGGTLQMLKIKDNDGYDTRNGQKQGASFTANWVTIDDPDPENADLDDLAVYKQGVAKGAATFARLEGIFPDPNGGAYFASTNGGNYLAGQIWHYEPESSDEGKLKLVFESPSREILDMPDNICLHPKSELLFICEDSDYSELSGTPENLIRILTPDGKIADLAKNITSKKESSEFAGSTFSDDGKTLFVNLQTVGVTLAIWGDWESFVR